MRTYVIRRLLMIIPTLFLVTLIVFFLLRFIPGDVIDLMVDQLASSSGGVSSDTTAESLRHALGLDVPVHVQYWHWLGGVLQGDLGDSLWTHRPVTETIGNALPVSVELGLLALIVGLVMAVPIGTYSAMRQDSLGDYSGRTIAMLAISVPSFWLATMVFVYPAVWWGWAPRVDFIPIAQDPAGNLGQFVLPAFILGMVLSGVTMRMTRTMMLEVLRQDYIRTAWSKGLRERTIVLRHALKNASMPVITIVGLQVPILIGGAVIIEQIFSLPGIGRLMLDAITRRDYPIISGINVILALFVLGSNLVVDLMYGYLDPRIQYE